MDFHSLTNGKRAGGHERFRAFDLHHADAAGALRLEPFEKTEGRNRNTRLLRCIEDHRALRHGYGNRVYETGRHYALLSELTVLP